MIAKCTFCGLEIFEQFALHDLNNNTYCKDCANKQFATKDLNKTYEWQPDELPEGLTEQEVIENAKDLVAFMKKIEKIPKVKELMKIYRVAVGKPPQNQEEQQQMIKNYSLYVMDLFGEKK